jgi:hypothetical protein
MSAQFLNEIGKTDDYVRTNAAELERTYLDKYAKDGDVLEGGNLTAKGLEILQILCTANRCRAKLQELDKHQDLASLEISSPMDTPVEKPSAGPKVVVPANKTRILYGRYTGMSNDMVVMLKYMMEHELVYYSTREMPLKAAVAKLQEASTTVVQTTLSAREASQLLFRLEWPLNRVTSPKWEQDLVAQGFPPILIKLVYHSMLYNVDADTTIIKWFNCHMHAPTSPLRAGSYKQPLHWWLNEGKEVKEEILKRKEEILSELQFDFMDGHWAEANITNGGFKAVISQDRPETPKPVVKKETKRSRPSRKNRKGKKDAVVSNPGSESDKPAKGANKTTKKVFSLKVENTAQKENSQEGFGGDHRKDGPESLRETIRQVLQEELSRLDPTGCQGSGNRGKGQKSSKKQSKKGKVKVNNYNNKRDNNYFELPSQNVVDGLYRASVGKGQTIPWKHNSDCKPASPIVVEAECNSTDAN